MKKQNAGDGTVIIKKYANRRLYNTETSSYITLDHLAAMIREGRDFKVVDAKSDVAPPDMFDLDRATLAFQRRHIARVLRRTSGSREQAAKLLGLSPATFYRYLSKVGLKGYRLEDKS